MRYSVASRKSGKKETMTAKRSSAATMVDTTAANLRELVLEKPAGSLLGSEEDLLQRLKVSRPTFRQAAQTLVSEQLLMVRRGAGGGYFTRLPSVDAIIHMATIYLSSSQSSLNEMLDVMDILLTRAVRLVAENPNMEERKRLLNMIEEREVEPLPENLVELNRLFLDLMSELGRIANNAILAMFVDIAMHLSDAQRTGTILTPKRAAELLALEKDMALYIYQGEPDFALIIYSRIRELTNSWYGNAQPQ